MGGGGRGRMEWGGKLAALHEGRAVADRGCGDVMKTKYTYFPVSCEQ